MVCEWLDFFTMLLRIAACVEVRERRRGARRKARVRKSELSLMIDFSLSLSKSSKLNTCSPFLSLFSRLVFSIRRKFINLPRLLRSLFAGLESIYPGK